MINVMQQHEKEMVANYAEYRPHLVNYGATYMTMKDIYTLYVKKPK